MSEVSTIFPEWLKSWMEGHQLTLWGAADLREFDTPADSSGNRFPRAVSFAIPMTPQIMESIQGGPNQAYADEYRRVNALINELSTELAQVIKNRGALALALAASVRSDPVNIKGDFPQKTAATRAGLGWIGKNCQLVTRPFGPWVRLGTVFTDLDLPCGPPTERNFCGRCTACIEACPASALQGNSWQPGLPREEILDVVKCDQWKKENYYQFHKGHNCGICSAVCPFGMKVLKRKLVET